MVHIEKMILEGFKSFNKKTVINFDKGFTAIVGANGSGKSNIIDAFVFVLGSLSTKDLRANKSSDLISNGGNGLKPAKAASVTIVFNNMDKKIPLSSEKIVINRKINIDGKGVYKLNNKRSTRKEIRNMLDLAGIMPNSSNMIMQGKLFELINMNDIERRELIEDLAGIASYNEKKEDAQKELVSIQENLGNISLLLNEVYLQMEDLEKEKKDAEKYIKLSEQQKIHEQSLLSIKIKESQVKIDKMKEESIQIEKDISQIEEKKTINLETIRDIEGKLNILKDKIKEMENSELYEISNKRKKLQKENTELKTSLKYIKEDSEKQISLEIKLKQSLETLYKQEEILSQEITEINYNKLEISKEMEKKQQEISQIESKISETDAKYIKIKEEKDQLEKQKDNRKDSLNKVKTDIEIIDNKIKTFQSNREKYEGQIFKSHDKIGGLKIKNRELKNKKKRQLGLEDMNEVNEKAIEQRMEMLNQEIKKLNEKNSQLKPYFKSSQKKLIEIQSEIKVKKNYNSTSRAIQELYTQKRKGNIPGIYGTIADLGSTDSKYHTAMEMAAGNRFNYVVVDHPITAENCILFLKENKLGRASFIPLSSIRVNAFEGHMPNSPDIYGRAVDLINFEKKYAPAFDYIFGRTVIVRDIQTARNLDVPASKVTLDGDVVNSSNLMTGGQKQKSRGMGFKSNEEEVLKDLQFEIEKYQGLINQNKERIDELQREISRLYKIKLSSVSKTNHFDQEIMVNKSKITQIKESIKEKETEIEEILKEIEELNEKKENLNLVLEQESKELSSLLEKIEEIQKILESSEEIALKKTLKELEKIYKKLNSRFNKIEINLAKKQTTLSENVIKSKSEIEVKLLEATNNINDLESKINSLTQDLKNNEISLQETLKRIAEKSEKLNELLNQKRSLKYVISEKKTENGTLEMKIHPLNLKINQYKMKSEQCMTNINEWRCLVEPEIEIEEKFLTMSVMKHEKEIDSINIQIEILGAINMRAIDKYNECERRFNELEIKNEQVIKERESILSFIQELEKEKKKVFMNTFESINKNFAYVFSKLSPNGEAKLEVENLEDPFAGGVNILARPGKKKWCLTQAMSGGEKTLTIIALILGIQMHVPSPYYVLDEIDAALDDANAALVADMVKELSCNSQFVIITHRDVTMARVDQLLGVSNQEGISNVVNLSIKNVLKSLESNIPDDAVKA